MSTLLKDLLDEKGVLLADGATGSNLFGVGLQTGDSPELWNTDHPDRIAQHYRNFVEAGSDIILTNTFGGTHFRMALHGAGKRVEELNVNAVKILKEEIEKSGRKIVCAGSMGPTGELLIPLGTMSHEQAVEAFKEQAEALKKGGVDVFWIETLSSPEEARAAVEACTGLGLPIVTTYSIDTNGRTMMGLSPDDIVKVSASIGKGSEQKKGTPLMAIGSNCGVGAPELVAAIINIKTALKDQENPPIIISKANCGVPEYINGEIVYSGTEAIMADYAGMAIDAGATIVGGCCGTSPNHVAAMRKAIDNHTKGATPTREDIESRLGELSTGAIAQMEGKLEIADGAFTKKDEPRRSRRRK
jgi:methionine synthase I (cobalamin-dependent)